MRCLIITSNMNIFKKITAFAINNSPVIIKPDTCKFSNFYIRQWKQMKSLRRKIDKSIFPGKSSRQPSRVIWQDFNFMIAKQNFSASSLCLSCITVGYLSVYLFLIFVNKLPKNPPQNCLPRFTNEAWSNTYQMNMTFTLLNKEASVKRFRGAHCTKCGRLQRRWCYDSLSYDIIGVFKSVCLLSDTSLWMSYSSSVDSITSLNGSRIIHFSTQSFIRFSTILH